jgi:hypothetical protein
VIVSKGRRFPSYSPKKEKFPNDLDTTIVREGHENTAL